MYYAKPTPDALKAKLNSQIKNERFQNTIIGLYSRWQDERGYESFSGYADVLKKALPAGCTFVKATKKPFGVQFSAKGMPSSLYAFECRSKGILWRRLNDATDTRPIAGPFGM